MTEVFNSSDASSDCNSVSDVEASNTQGHIVFYVVSVCTDHVVFNCNNLLINTKKADVKVKVVNQNMYIKATHDSGVIYYLLLLWIQEILMSGLKIIM